MEGSLNHFISAIRVSSVLNGDDEQFGRKYLIDGSTNTCWNSDEGKSQYIMFKFKTPVNISSIRMTFQGGFSCRSVTFSAASISLDDKLLFKRISSHLMDDTNSTATFDSKSTGVISLKCVMDDITDFFGRVIVYSMVVYGTVVGDEAVVGDEVC